MNTQQLLDYLDHTPWNTNRNYLRSVLEDFQSEGASARMGDLEKQVLFQDRVKKADYLYEVWLNNIDYDYALNEYKKLNPDAVAALGACTGVRAGNWFGRNFDWYYDEGVEFLVHTPNLGERNASIGMADALNKITKNMVEAGEWNEVYKLMPFTLTDGINEHGVVITENVVPTDLGETTKTVPLIEEKVELCALMIPRFVLDFCDSAQGAAEFIRDYMSVYMPDSLHASKYEVHFMIADKDHTYSVEFIDNAAVIEEISERPWITNFYLNGVEFNNDNTVTINRDGAPNESGITENGCGLERFNLVANEIDSADSHDGMRALMSDLFYTNSYAADADWYSEFVGINGLTCSSPVEDCVPIRDTAHALFENRSRDKSSPYYGSWITAHSAVYDIENKKIYVVSQEDDEIEFEAKLKLPDGGSGEVGYDVIANGNVTEINGKTVLTPLGAYENTTQMDYVFSTPITELGPSGFENVPFGRELVGGRKYKIAFNGEEKYYDSISDPEPKVLIIGDEFNISYYPNGTVIGSTTLELGLGETFTIEFVEETALSKIDEKYIPDKSFVEFYIDTTSNVNSVYLDYELTERASVDDIDMGAITYFYDVSSDKDYLPIFIDYTVVYIVTLNDGTGEVTPMAFTFELGD